MSILAETDRYARQDVAFSESHRGATALQVFGGDVNALFARALAAGAAGAGIALASDFHDPCGDGSHFLSGPIPDMVAQINREVAYHYVDAFAAAADCEPILARRSHAWTALPIADVETTRRVLEEFRSARIGTRVLLWQTGPGGVLVERCSGPTAGLDRLETVPRLDEVPAGRPELAILAAGAVLSEVMSPQAFEAEDELPSFRTVMVYSFHRRDRVTPVEEGLSLGDLAGEIALGRGQETIELTDRELAVVGVGALGQWYLLGPAWAGEGLRVVIYDKDPEIALHNVSRQPVGCRSVGPNPKPHVVATELQGLDPRGQYRAVFRAIRSPEDFDSLGSAAAVAALPDSDAPRAVSGDAALGAGLPFGTAGSSVLGAQSVVCRPDRGACVRCLLGLDGSDGSAARPASCAFQAGSVVGTNMVGAAINLAEMRRTLSGLPLANVRFSTTGHHGNRLERMVSHPPNCEHVDAARANT